MLSSLLPGTALAQDFVIDSGQTAGPQVMTGVGDTGVVRQGGRVIATGGAAAVQMSGANQTLENLGEVEATDPNGRGIYASSANASITNAGSITTTGQLGYGIRSDSIATTIVNSGSIQTSGNTAFGIHANSDNAVVTNGGNILTSGQDAVGFFSTGDAATLVNTGSIRTSGQDAWAIGSGSADLLLSNTGSLITTGTGARAIFSIGTNASISNSGLIQTSGSDAWAIYTQGSAATVSNTGRIVTSGTAAHGIRSFSSNVEITNAGTVAVSGAGAYGIYVLGTNATVTNSGRVVSAQSEAIRFDQGSATLNLKAGSAIQGGIWFSGAGNTATFGPGLNARITFSGTGLPATIATDDSPYLVSGNTVTVLDRTAFASGFALTDDMLFSVVGSVAGTAGAAADRCRQDAAPGADCQASVWMTGSGSYGERAGDGTFNDYDHHDGAVLAGLEFAPQGGISYGMFAGGVAAAGSAGTLYETDAAGAVAGAHLGYSRDGYFIDLASTFGLLDIDGERIFADNTVAGGLETSEGRYNALFVSPSLTLGTRVDTAYGLLTPSLRLRHTRLFLDDHDETGSASNATLELSERDASEIEARLQLELAIPPTMLESGRLATALRIGGDILHRDGSTADVGDGTQSFAMDTGQDGVMYRGFVGIDASLAIDDGTSLFGKAEFALDDEGGRSAQFRTGLSVKF